MRTLYYFLAAMICLATTANWLGAQTTLSASTDANTITPNNSVSCSNVFGQSDNSYVRTYNTATGFTATAIRLGIEVDEYQPQTLDIRFWNYTAGTPSITLGLQIGATQTITTPGNGSWSETVQTIALDAPVAIPSGNFAVEVQQRNNQWTTGLRTGPGNFFFGTNAAGESSPTYLMAAACGAADPTDITALVSGSTIHAILDVVGYTTGAPTSEIDVRFPTGANNTLPSGSGVADVGPFPQSATTNAVIQVANQGTSAGLTITSATATGASNCTTGTVSAPGSVAAGSTANIQIPVTLGAGLVNWSFTLTINSSDADEGTYTITVQGTAGMSGTYTVISGGGGDYTDIGPAFDDLETYGVTGATVIEIAAGTYTTTTSYELGSDTGGATVDAVRGLSATNTLTIQAASGASPVISGDSFIDPVAGTETGVMSVNGVSHLTFDGLEFTGGTGFGLFVCFDAGPAIGSIGTYATDLTVRNCKFHSIVNGPGLFVNGNFAPYHDVLIENCMLWNNGIGDSAYGLAMPGAIGFFFPGENVVVNHCTVLNDAGVTSAGTGQPAAIGWTGGSELVRTNPEITNCILVSDGTNKPCYAFPNDDPSNTNAITSEPSVADRNVLYTLNGGIVGMSYLVTQTVTTTTLTFPTLSQWQAQFNSVDQNSVNTNPNLTSATDLHIGSGSSAIDLAVGSGLATDIDGDPRTTGAAPDAGADENTGTPTGPTVNISATDPTAAEATPSNQTGTYTITFTPTTTGSITLNFTMSGTGSLTPGTDYDLTTSTAGATVNWTGPGGTITVPSGTSSVVITLTPVDDAAAESAESAIMTINSGTGYTLGTTLSDTVSIADNDGGVTPTITITSTGSPAEAGPVTGTFTLTATPVPSTPLSVTISLSGTASLGPDYLITSSTTVTIPVTGTATVTMTPVDDTTGEASETVIMTVVAGVGYTVGAPSSATLSIIDDDGGAPTPTVGGGGGGGGGGCVAMRDESSWLLALALLALAGVATRMRLRRE